MLFSISLILLVGMAMGWILRKLKLPSLIGMLLTDIVLFSTFVSILQGESASVVSFVNIPVSIVLGILIGFVIGICRGIQLQPKLIKAFVDAI